MIYIYNLFIKLGSKKNFPKSLVSHTVLTLCIALVFYAGSAYSQNSGNVIPPTPIAAQYEKYINYPINHNTGTVNVEVPLYTLKTKSGISVPVTLSYHTSGVKPSDNYLPVGLGWVINPGARITRTIVGVVLPRTPRLIDTMQNMTSLLIIQAPG